MPKKKRLRTKLGEAIAAIYCAKRITLEDALEDAPNFAKFLMREFH